MKITALKAQVKNPERVSVFVDEAYAFSLTVAQLLEQKLRSGLELDQERLEALKKVSDFGKAYERLLHYALLRPHSYYEMVLYCRRKNINEDDANQILTILRDRGYVNDESFARSWVASRRAYKPTSKKRLRLELRQKGISTATIELVLDEIEEGDASALQRIITKKRRQSRYKDNQKLTEYLLRQGFQFDHIQQALRGDLLDYSEEE